MFVRQVCKDLVPGPSKVRKLRIIRGRFSFSLEAERNLGIMQSKLG